MTGANGKKQSGQIATPNQQNSGRNSGSALTSEPLAQRSKSSSVETGGVLRWVR